MPDERDDTALDAVRSMVGKGHERLSGALAVYALGAGVARLANRWWLSARARMTYTVSVPGNDAIYPDLHVWLLRNLPAAKQRALTAKSQKNDALVAGDSGTRARERPETRFFYDGLREQTIRLDGHRVNVAVVRPNLDIGDLITNEYESRSSLLAGRERIVFTTYSTPGRDATIRFLQRVTDEHYAAATQPDFLMADKWRSGFERRSDLPRRPLDTVVLRAGQKERLIDDLATFLAQEDDYARLGMPWHRGYLLHGPPGTGKTSVAKALANHFGLDVYYIPLTDQKADTDLLSLLSRVSPRSVLLLEDIDILHASTSRDEEDNSVSLSGLLNALDGVSTPHGLITIMTTNDRSRLDPALVRPGRVDVAEEIGLLDDHQLRGLFDMFYGGGSASLPPLDHARLSPAEAVEVFKRNIGSPSLAAAELELLIDAAAYA